MAAKKKNKEKEINWILVAGLAIVVLLLVFFYFRSQQAEPVLDEVPTFEQVEESAQDDMVMEGEEEMEATPSASPTETMIEEGGE